MMKRSSLEPCLVTFLAWLAVSEATNDTKVNVPGDGGGRQPRLYDISASSSYPTLSADSVRQQALFPFQSPSSGFAVPKGAVERSDVGNGEKAFSIFQLPSSTSFASAMPALPPAGQKAFSESNTRPDTMDTSATRNLDPSDGPDMPDDPSGSHPKFDLRINPGVQAAIALRALRKDPSQTIQQNSNTPIQTTGDSSASEFLSSITARQGPIGGSSLGYGNTGYVNSVPNGASFAQSSHNTVSGSVYYPGYGGKQSTSFYGAQMPYAAGAPSAAFYPYYLYYPVEYGYDQGERSVMPTGPGWFPLIGYKRRYGYRSGPYYGYGVYVDYPPYFGFGKVKDGWGSDPEADVMASVALAQGAGASEDLGIQAQAASNSNNYGGNGGYSGAVGSSSNAYGNNAGSKYGSSGYAPGSTAGYGNSYGSNAYSPGSTAGYGNSYGSNAASNFQKPPYSSAPSSSSTSMTPSASQYPAAVSSSYQGSQPSGQYGKPVSVPSSSGVSQVYGQANGAQLGAATSQYNALIGQ